METVSAHFGAPIALVSLVDADRLWFKAVAGLDVRETGRNHSFCTHAIMHPDAVMVVEDARADPRFHGNPLVDQDPPVRFYAGAPIVTECGARLGTVCVMDRQPRAFAAADRDMLARFARTALSLLELHRRNELLREAATLDPLTGLLNRRGLERTLRQTMASSLNGENCGLLHIDIDQFKQINILYGHATGDGLLEEIGRRLQLAVRHGDVVARFGGDEFVILLVHPVDATAIEVIAQRVLWTCGASVTIKGHTIIPGITVGGAMAPRDAITHGDLLRVADAALYAAKRSGRGRVVIAGADNSFATEDGLRPEIALSEAIDRDELFLEWQSCHDIRTGAIAGYEALVRWNHPDHGRLAPERFVPLAEACGLSSRLDAWVMFHACEEAARCPGDSYFSVNISAQWIANGGVVSLIRAALEQSGLSPGRLILEITETTAIGSEHDAIAHMHQLREMGVRLALDDFGTGYSALACLQTYPFDMLKLDRKSVSAISINKRGRLVSESVIRLAKMLDIEVVAEGIETQAQADLLAELGCHRGQGFLWAEAQTAPWLSDGNEDTHEDTQKAVRSAPIAQPSSNPGAVADPAVPVAPHSEQAIPDSLPPADTKRWVPRRKAEVVAAVDGGVISIDFVCQRYNLTLEEFESWQRAVDRGGLKKWRMARTQFYRDLCENAARPSVAVPLTHDAPVEKSTAGDAWRVPSPTDRPVGDDVQGADTGNRLRGSRIASQPFAPGQPAAERRDQSRLALLLRVAKLVVDGREQFCIVRDASTTGVRIKVFVPLPEHDVLAVELANGDRYPVRCVWSDGENAGLQFCEPVPLENLLNYAKNADRRRHVRLRIALDGLLHLGETTAPITFRDFSQHGASFKTEKWLLVNELVKIETAILPIIYARVRWRNHPNYGVSFEHTFQLQDLALRISDAQARSERDGDGASSALA